MYSIMETYLKSQPIFHPAKKFKDGNVSKYLKSHILEQEGRGYHDRDIDLITVPTTQWPLNVIGPRKQIKKLR